MLRSAVLGVLLSFAATAQAATVLKLASLAPEGSTWWKVFVHGDKLVRERTQGRVEIRLYAGGVAGDEPDFVRKMRVGQLAGAAMTSVGLGEIAQELLVLQVPGLFRTYEELDGARRKLADRFKAVLTEKGYTVMFWGDVGFNRFFSVTPVHTPDDLKQTKPWVWTQDSVYHALFKGTGIQAIPTGVPEVLPGLQTGLINAFSTPPLAAVALQWFSRSKYMLDLPLNVTIGAVLLSNKVLEKLSPEDRQAVFDVGQIAEVEMFRAVREDNDKAVEAISKAGIQIVKPDPKNAQKWQEFFDRGAANGVGGIYPQELLNDVRKAVAGIRGS